MKIVFVLSVLLLTNLHANAQELKPYKIPFSDEQYDVDSIWVLFPDIRACKTSIILPSYPISNPQFLSEGDSIMLDTTYDLYLKVKKIEPVDDDNVKVFFSLPNREGTVLRLDYRTFGNTWVFEGRTGHEPMSCDHLTINLYDPNKIILGLSESWNCQ